MAFQEKICGYWSVFKSKFLKFFEINYSTLGSSLKEVFWLTIIAFLPLIITLIITAIDLNHNAIKANISQDSIIFYFRKSLQLNIKPGEIVAFALSFIAPTFYLLVKTNGKGYRLPYILLVSIITIIVYCLTACLYVVAQLGILKSINMEPQHGDLYYILSLVFLLVTFLIGIYTTYHNDRYTDFSYSLREEQKNFNSHFVNSINRGGTS